MSAAAAPSKLTRERLAVLVVGALFAASELLAPIWVLRWKHGATTRESQWLWSPPETEAVAEAYIDWSPTLVQVGVVTLAVVVLWWFVGVGRNPSPTRG